MTGGGAGERFVIRYSYRDDDKEEAPDGWPLLVLPEPGETLADYLARVARDRFLTSLVNRTFREPARPLKVIRPAERTLAWWEEKWPDRVPNHPWEEALPRNYLRDRVFWRLMVEVVARLAAGDLVLKARRLDDPTATLVAIEPSLYRNPFMVLRPRASGGGWFRAESWHGNEPPPGLRFRELSLWPAETAEVSPVAVPAVEPPPPPLRRHRAGLDYRASDDALAAEVIKGVMDANGQLLNDWAACGALADRAAGKASIASKQKRLHKRVQLLRHMKSCLSPEPTE